MAGHANHAANAAAWAAMRAEQAAAMEQRRAERAAEKAARREANRAAWWGRYGLEAPGAEQAEPVEQAEETRRDEADAVAVFVDGMRLECGQVVYTVEHATASKVRVRTEAAGAVKRQTLTLHRGPRGQYVKLHANSKAERVIYAADLAA